VRLGTRLFLAYFLIFVLCFSYPIFRIASDLRVRYLEGVEEPLIDQANILAAWVGHEMEAGRFDPEVLYQVFEESTSRTLSARIYELPKARVDMHLYITDAAGKVIFDSESRDSIGKDYARWRDVRLTLEGEYGARTTLMDPEDPTTSVLYVAAPVVVGGEIAGVLTVVEPTESINAFLETAKPRIFKIGAVSAVAAVFLGLLVSWWVTNQIQRLTCYANDVREGKKVELPPLARTELAEMGGAFEKMRQSLEGKNYVERYVQTLTHELKSPVSAIRGAAELLGEEMPPEKRDQFLANIRNEAVRIQELVERMLKLAELETRQSLSRIETVPVALLLQAILESKEPMRSQKELTIDVRMPDELAIKADPFLFHQAVSNLLQNAIDFSPQRGKILLEVLAERGTITFRVEDEGPGIPDYAKEKVFEKFFSLQRPDTGRKSTGLGLNFVREVAVLHKGQLAVENLPQKGLRARLSIPI
jgi:two-component system sensor histidine kinase CreC